MNKYNIIPSTLQYQAAPAVDQEVTIGLEEQSQQLVEYDRSATISLAQIYDDERQICTIFRPTFKVNYVYANTITGTTTYLPFQYNLYYVSPEESKGSGIWKGFPQYYEFDFYRPNINDQHLTYKSKSAYTYNWTYYLTYASENDSNKQLFYTSPNLGTINWVAKDGIPFSINNSNFNGSSVIEFQCIAPHGLLPGEFVELSISYENNNLYQVYSLGNGLTDSDQYIYTIFNLGYTGNTFSTGVEGTFKRVTNPDNILETTSKYYIRKHKIMTDVEDIIVSKNGFEKNVFGEEKKFEYSSITPNNISRISQKTSSNSYNFTIEKDIDLFGVLDNQKRPVTELFLTIVNKGYSGYFNEPTAGVGLKQGWDFNITSTPNTWWNTTNVNSNTNIPVSSYTQTNGSTEIFYYNQDLKKDDLIDGDFCEWNDFEQTERVISTYYHKIKYNQNIFQVTNLNDPNAPGYYYKPHNSMTIRVFSDYVETGSADIVENIPSYAFYSSSDQEFRWRDLYTYGYIDQAERGVDYPFLNTAQYPFTDFVFRLIPEGINFTDNQGIDFPIKPLIDGCE